MALLFLVGSTIGTLARELCEVSALGAQNEPLVNQKAAGQREADTKKRNDYYMHAEKIISEDSPCVCFWHKTDFTLRQPGLRNYRMYPIYSMDKGLEVSF